MTRDERAQLSALLARLADGDRDAFAPLRVLARERVRHQARRARGDEHRDLPSPEDALLDAELRAMFADHLAEIASAWPALVLAGLCISLGGRLIATIGVALVLAATIAVAVHRGRHHARAVAPGLLAGAPPVFSPVGFPMFAADRCGSPPSLRYSRARSAVSLLVWLDSRAWPWACRWVRQSGGY